MKTEEMLKRVYAIMRALPQGDQDFVEKQVSRHDIVKTKEPPVFVLVGNLLVYLKDELSKEEAKKSGNGDALKAAKDILKTAQAQYRKEQLYRAPVVNGKQCLCDGYRAARLVNHLPLSVSDDERDYVNLERIIPPLHKAGDELELPDIKKLKAYIKDQKAKDSRKTPKYCFGCKTVDARYLASMMDLLPNAKAYTDTNNKVTCVTFFAEDGSDGVLLPLRDENPIKTVL